MKKCVYIRSEAKIVEQQLEVLEGDRKEALNRKKSRHKQLIRNKSVMKV
ncbi:MAG: hypothetical protein ACFE91_14410 [Promethearchaeota archaeon]